MAVIIIEDWMIERECLTGFELLAFALIHTCTQKGDGCWYAGYDKLAQRIGATQRTAIMCVKSLEESGRIRVFDSMIGGRNRKAIESLISSEISSSEIISSENFSEQRGEIFSDNSKDNSNKKEEYTKVYSKKESAKRFVKPSVEEIRAYCQERRNGIDAAKLFDFYESKGWLVGKSPMKDWKAAVRNWERMEQDKHPKEKPEKLLTSKDLRKLMNNG